MRRPLPKEASLQSCGPNMGDRPLESVARESPSVRPLGKKIFLIEKSLQADIKIVRAFASEIDEIASKTPITFHDQMVYKNPLSTHGQSKSNCARGIVFS